MIIQRISKGIKNQDWFVVMVEIMIVVVGIFIGLQVDDWNENRKDTELRQQYLLRLSGDIENDLRNAREHLNYFQGVKKYGEKALKYLNLPASEKSPKSETLLAFMLASSHWENVEAQGTYDELKNTGRFHILGSYDLRNTLVLYYNANSVRQNDIVEHPPYFELIRSIVHPDLQDRIINTCETTSDSIQVSLVIDEACKIDIDTGMVASQLNKIESNPQIKPDLIFAISQLRYNNSLFQEQASTSEKVLSILKEEMKQF